MLLFDPRVWQADEQTPFSCRIRFNRATFTGTGLTKRNVENVVEKKKKDLTDRWRCGMGGERVGDSRLH